MNGAFKILMNNFHTASATIIVFDDENAASEYKQVLIEKFRMSEVSTAQVGAAFDAAKILTEA